jgi:hypothetical protein
MNVLARTFEATGVFGLSIKGGSMCDNSCCAAEVPIILYSVFSF